MLGPDDLVLCAGTVMGSSFRERVEAAAAAGYRGITLWAMDYRAARDDGLSAADMRAMLADNGLAIGELDGVSSWLPAGPGVAAAAMAEREAAGLVIPERVFWEVADELGGRSLNVFELFGDAVDTEVAAEAFAGLCDRAGEHGLLVHIEPLPWSGIGDVHAAAAITRLAGRANGGVLLDTWHHFRAGLDAAALTPEVAAHVNGIQISDAPALAESDPMDECSHRRLLPGEGAADVAGVLRALRAGGVDAPVGVEVFSDALREPGMSSAAARAAEAARAVVDAAR